MTNAKDIKKALFSSIMVMILCCAMLVATTFAWFTDSVKSSSNVISSGKLDVDLLADGSEESKADKPIFNQDVKWEPGYREGHVLQIVNKGDLSAKFKLVFSVTGDAELAEVINVYEKDLYDLNTCPAFNADEYTIDTLTLIGSLKDLIDKPEVLSGTLESNCRSTKVIVMQMAPDAGNKYQAQNINIDITVLATQNTKEIDSYDDSYDAGATLDFVSVNTQSQFETAIEAGKNVSLYTDITMDNVVKIGSDIVIQANGKTITSSSARALRATTANSTITLNGANLVVKDNAENASNRGVQIDTDIDNVKIVVNNSKITMTDKRDNYGVNICGNTNNCYVELNNCEITAYQCVNVYGNNHTVVINNCILNSINNHNKGWSGGCLNLFENSSATITVVNTQFNTNSADGFAKNSAVAVFDAAVGGSITIDSCTHNGLPFTKSDVVNNKTNVNVIVK